MAYVITDLCIRTGDCVEVCQEECIIPGPPDNEKWNKYFYIDPDECIDCGDCVSECPEEGAIVPEAEASEEDIERNADFFAKGAPGYTADEWWDLDYLDDYRGLPE